MTIMKISVFGLGYVGSVTATCFADKGHDVIGVEVNPDKLALFRAGQTPLFEPGLAELLAKVHGADRFGATADAADSQAIVVHVDPSAFRPLTGRESWSPDGLLCYSKICTHAGCPVGLYEQQSNRLFCPCHQSVFDVLDGAAPSAGPATRPLPQLPLGVDAQGYLQAQGDFNAFVGPGFWNEGSA